MRIRNRATAVAITTALFLGSSLPLALAAEPADGTASDVVDGAEQPEVDDDADDAEVEREFEAEVDRPVVMLGDEVVVEAKYKVKVDEVEDDADDETESDDAEDDTDADESDELDETDGDDTDGSEDDTVVAASEDSVTLVEGDTSTSTATSELPSTVVFTVDYGDGTVVDLAIDELEVDAEEFEAETEGEPHVYAAEGIYTVAVTATPDVGDAETITFEVLVTTDPVAYDRGIDRACPEPQDDDTPDAGDDTVVAAATGFADIAGSRHERAIACLAALGVVTGRSATDFSPGSHVTRAQVASMLARLAEDLGLQLPDAVDDAFADDEGSVHEDAINQLAELGLLGGTAAGEFSPEESLSRQQMASLLVRLYEQVTAAELTAELDYFADDDGSVHEGAINAAAAAGIATGQELRMFAGDGEVTREQVATFVARLLDAVVESGDTTA